jgi:hypothetical protein
LELLVQYGIGLKKKTVEYCEVDEEVFRDVPEEEADGTEEQEVATGDEV